MGILTACLDKVFESWPVVKAGFDGQMDAPWDEKLQIGGRVAEQASQSLSMFMSPDFFYKSPAGRELVEGVADKVGKEGEKISGHSGLTGADLQSKLLTSRWVERNKNLLAMTDPQWEGAGGRFDPEVAQALTDFTRGRVQLEDLPSSLREPFAKINQEFVDRYNDNEALRVLAPGKEADASGKMQPTWKLGDDLIEPTVKELVQADNPMISSGLLKVLPKQIFQKIVEQGDAAGISATDWMKIANPMTARKVMFDPVIEAMREAIPKMGGLEQDYTKALLQRVVGTRTTLQNGVDNMLMSVKYGFDAPKATISPSAKFATGVTNTFYRSMVLYNPAVAALHLTQNVNTLSKFGLKETLGGLENFFSKSGRELAAERAVLGDLDRFHFTQAPPGTWQNALQKFEHVGYAMFDAAQNFGRGLAFHTGLNRFMQENGIKSLEDFTALRTGSDAQKALFNQGMLKGIEAANDTFFLYGVAHQSPYLSSPMGKLIGGQFMSFPLRQTEFFLKEWRQQGAIFPARFMAYTGMASALAYYGLGISLGNKLGGAASVPEALDLLQAGKTSEAVWAAGSGMFKMLPESYALANGITPFGNMLLTTMNLLSSEDPEVKWAKFGRNTELLLPAGLQIRRTLESAMTQFANDGERNTPQGFTEGMGLPTALSKAAQEVFGQPIPGVSPRYTGALTTPQTGVESLETGLGFRTREDEITSRLSEINKAADVQAKQGMEDHANAIAQALLHGKPEDVDAAMKAAMASGAFANPTSLNNSVESAIMRQKLTRPQREQKNAPLTEKIRRAQP